MTRDPELAHRLRLAIDEERAETRMAIRAVALGRLFDDRRVVAAREATDALVEQLATP